MALTSVTYEELLERNERKLLQKGVTPDISPEAVSALRAAPRRRVQALLAERADLHTLASTDDQRQAYGPEQWNAEFVALRDLTEHPRTHHEGTALQTKVWTAIPNSRFKRFQMLFCKPSDYIVPRFDINEEGAVVFSGSPDFDSLSLAPCLVSADCIPEKLAEDLQLCDFREQRGTNMSEKRLRTKRDAIPRLKNIWESAVPLQEGNQRLLAIMPSDATTNDRYGDAPGPREETLGSILYIREHTPTEEDPRPLTVQYFRSVYGAYRKTLHQRAGYDEELPSLVTMEEDVRALIGRLNTQWSNPENRAALRGECEVIANSCISELAQCENKFKVQAHDLLEEARPLRDALGRENPTVAMTKLVAVINRFTKRYNEADGKGDCNERDRRLLQGHIARNERIFETFRGSVVQGSRVLEQLPFDPFGREDLPQKQADAQTTWIRNRMRIDPEALQRLTLQPHRSYGEALGDQYDDLLLACRAGDRTWAKHSAIRMHLAGKFQAARSHFERMKAHIAANGDLPSSQLRTFVAFLHGFFSEHQVFPAEVVQEFRQPFEELEKRFTSLVDDVAQKEQQPMDAGQRSDFVKEVKRKLDAIDIETFALRLIEA